VKITHAPGATPLDADEIAALVPTSISTQEELNAFEQANILDAERWALARRRADVLDEKFIRELHRRMFKQVWKWAGRYRKSDKNIGAPWPQIPVKVVELCSDVRHWIEHSTFEWDELAARFHHRLVSIHPFPNGNGRHSRLMTDVVLFGNGQKVFTWGSTNLVAPGQAREQYIAALKAADARDFARLIAFVRA
jgi:Fic-DOC domain mobile mystery protein B